MDWIKRNLYFVVGGVVALALLGLGGFYFYTKWQLNNEIWDKLNADYQELARLGGERPHPGSPSVDNIQTAKQQTAELVALKEKARAHFQRIPPIPDSAKVTDQDFSAALTRTLSKLQREANIASVLLVSNYNFSFQAEQPKVSFNAAGLPALATQLGEVRAICDVLFKAKINALDSIRRERVSQDDSTGPQTDYLGEKSVTNDQAVLTPYELTFRCFSPELASVISGFASSPNSLVVKSLNVDVAPAVMTPTEPATPTPMYVPPPIIQQPVPFGSPGPRRSEGGEGDSFMRRYGIGKYAVPPPVAQPAPVVVAAAPPSKGGLPTVLDERQLRITMMITVVKMEPAKAGK